MKSLCAICMLMSSASLYAGSDNDAIAIINLTAEKAGIEGNGPVIRDRMIKGWTSIEPVFSWRFNVNIPGTYHVISHQIAPKQVAGSEYHVDCNGTKLNTVIQDIKGLLW